VKNLKTSQLFYSRINELNKVSEIGFHTMHGSAPYVLFVKTDPIQKNRKEVMFRGRYKIPTPLKITTTQGLLTKSDHRIEETENQHFKT